MRGILFAVLRHAPTTWNEGRRLQGMTDVPLSAEGEAIAASWTLPSPIHGWRRFCSPLARARRTAELLQPSAVPVVDPRLREMSFGAWEGRTVAELRMTLGATFIDAEGRGLDFEPPGGESPRTVMARLGEWASDIAASSEPALAVSHKAVIRAFLALATGWDMTGRQPIKLDWQKLHLFRAHRDGHVTLEQANVDMDRA
ncbi:probable phosphoglycerate mutase [Enhydrobacter aerosaccus]|uniref:Probable phosphoglycerate mutase n=1 Tax=Enhydrobacter aerosaccus TaxID=225324 RepID=A0A1T4QP29_9HYPH|nr:histidine phosphatase family protein [Enhydrobacter aerosaccus]SKA05221.1 probable phosphoglycerate mutase [Enhydrobacter aerosaccus]